MKYQKKSRHKTRLQPSIIHHKIQTCQKPLEGLERLKSMLKQINFFFEVNTVKFLGAAKPFTNNTDDNYNFIRVINQDLKQTCETYRFIDNFTTHFFRVGYIRKALKIIKRLCLK